MNLHFSRIQSSFTRLLLLIILGSSLALSAAAQRFRAIVPYENQGGKLIVSLRVNGQSARFLLDTGAPCCVSHEFATRIGLKAGESQTGEDSNGRAVQASLVKLDSLQLGAVTFRNIQAMKWEEDNPSGQLIDGILGYNLLRMGIVKWNSQQRQFIFTTLSEGLGLDFSRALPLLPHDYVPMVVVKLGKTASDTVMFDSGAEGFYEMSNRQQARLTRDRSTARILATAEGSLSMGASGIEAATTKHRILVPQLEISRFRFADVATTTTDGTASRIGSQLLNYGDVAIDFPRNTFYFLPHPDQKAPLKVYHPEWEVVPTITTNGEVVAGIVWNAKLPIHQGDRIVEINGQRCERIDFAKAVTTPPFVLSGKKTEIVFIAKGSTQEQRLTIRCK